MNVKAEWQWAISLAIAAAMVAMLVMLWDNTIDALQEFEHRITKLEQQMEALSNARSQ